MSELTFEEAASLLTQDSVNYVDIVKDEMIGTQILKNVTVAYVNGVDLTTNGNVIYKYDPNDNNGLPLYIDIAGGDNDHGLIVYDPSPDDYTIVGDESYRYISSFVYRYYQTDHVLYSTNRDAPVVIWNTHLGAEDTYGVAPTYTDSYNKYKSEMGSLRTLVDFSKDSEYFRKGLRLFGGTNNGNSTFKPLIGTNTYMVPETTTTTEDNEITTTENQESTTTETPEPELVYVPEYKPFFFFFGPQNYEDAEDSFIAHVEYNLIPAETTNDEIVIPEPTVGNNKYRKRRIASALGLIYILNALNESQRCNCDAFDDKFNERIEELTQYVLDEPMNVPK